MRCQGVRRLLVGVSAVAWIVPTSAEATFPFTWGSDGAATGISAWSSLVENDGSDGSYVAALAPGQGIVVVKMAPEGFLRWEAPPIAPDANAVSVLLSVADGVIVAWQSSSGLQAQKLDRGGSPVWSGATTLGAGGAWASAVPDDAGGALVCWKSQSGTEISVTMARIDLYGVVQWTTVVDTYDEGEDNPGCPVRSIRADHAGAYVVWTRVLNPSNWTRLHVQRISAEGGAWASTYQATLAPYLITELKGVPDGSGDVLLTWVESDFFNGDHIGLQKVVDGGSGGTSPWERLISWPGDQNTIGVGSDGQGGIFVAYRDSQGCSGSTTSSIKVQRIGRSGGVHPVVCVREEATVNNPQVVPDLRGGAVVVWEEVNVLNPVEEEFRATRLTPDGFYAWSPARASLGTGTVVDAAGDGEGGTVVSWRESGGEIRANRAWDHEGAAILTSNSLPSAPLLATPEGNGDSLIVTVQFDPVQIGFDPVPASAIQLRLGLDRLYSADCQSIITAEADAGPSNNYTTRIVAPRLAGGGMDYLSVYRGEEPLGMVYFAAKTADFNGDGDVNLTDLGIITSAYNKNKGSVGYRWIVDVVDDGAINLGDVGEFGMQNGESMGCTPATQHALPQSATPGDMPLAGDGAPRPEVRETTIASIRATPNPAREGVVFAVRTIAPVPVSVDVVSVTGRLVMRLHDGAAGSLDHLVRWDGRGADGTRIAPGTYFYRVGAAGEVATGKVTLLR